MQRRPVGQPYGEGAAADRRTSSRGGTQLGRRDRVDLADRVVELADRAEPGRERDLGQPEVGRLDQRSSGLRPLGPRQCQGTGADLGHEHPVEVPRRVTEPVGEPVDAVAIDHSVADEPHRTTHHVGADIPLGGAGSGVGTAAAAGAISEAVSGRGGRIERDVLPARSDRRARRPAVDAGRRHRRDEPAVEPLVPAVDGPITPLEVEFHVVNRASRV